MIRVAARMAEQLVQAGPKVFVLCTTREPLRAEGEWVYQVQPLDVPAEVVLTPDDVLRTGAAKLFVMRARAAQPSFHVDPSVAASLGAICRRLDGMPLAIEFAAVRGAVLGVEEVALRLDNRFRLPGEGAELTAALVPLWLQLSLMQEWAKRVEQALQVVASSPQSDPRLMGQVLHVIGDQRGARLHLDSIFGGETYRFPLLEHDLEARVITLGPVLWFQGFPDQAARIAAEAVADVVEVGHGTTLCHVLGLLAWPIAILVGDLVQAQRAVKLLLEMPAQKALFYQSWAHAMEAALLIERGQVAGGVQALQAALAQHSKANSNFYESILNVILAEGLGILGEMAAGLAVIERALADSDATEARWYMPEQLRIKGELILLTGAQNAVAEAESCYAQSLSWARRQGAPSWELRTATSLARLRQQQGRTVEALNSLQPVYARFTEGFHTADLMAASTLLESLRVAAGAAQSGSVLPSLSLNAVLKRFQEILRFRQRQQALARAQSSRSTPRNTDTKRQPAAVPRRLATPLTPSR